MRIAACLLLACSLLACAAASSASAAERMWFGFQDDPTLRWRDDRAAMFDRTQQYDASIVRTTVYWSRTAPSKPTSATNSFDPAYRFDDLDEFVRNAATRGIAVMLTIWGTPSWANGGKGQNVPPRHRCPPRRRTSRRRPPPTWCRSSPSPPRRALPRVGGPSPSRLRQAPAGRA